MWKGDMLLEVLGPIDPRGDLFLWIWLAGQVLTIGLLITVVVLLLRRR